MLINAFFAAAACAVLFHGVHGARPLEPDSTIIPAPSHSPSITSPRPNVLVIMTDDQDKIMSGEKAMPNVVEKIAKQGVTYEKHFCTVAWCCPSRVNFFTGKAAHNTNVTSISPPYGGWSKFIKEGLNDDWLPVWLKEEGIDTYYVGKLMNGYSRGNFDKERPKGWTHSSFLVDPNTYIYHNATFTNDDYDSLENFEGMHTTDATRIKAISYLDLAALSNKPFFMMVAPVAPHLQNYGGNGPVPPTPPGFENNFTDEAVPRTPNFNPIEKSGASWVYELERLKDKTIRKGDEIYRHRLQNIAGVDNMVSQLIDVLEARGQLENTYIIYTSDNGFHIGQHRLHPGKRCGFEEDINIPLYIRGPDVAKNQKSEILNSHTDMAPTILKMFNISIDDKYHFDGAPVAYTIEDLNGSTKRELINVEFWDSSRTIPLPYSKRSKPNKPDHDDDDDGNHTDGDLQPADTNYGNTYKSIRMRSGNDSFYYSVFCSGGTSKNAPDHEFYDMNTDSQQMNNLYPNSNFSDPKILTAATYFSRSADQLLPRLDALLMVLKSCKEDTCRNPWPSLFPNGEVDSLEDAMAAKYDSFFKKQPKVSFSGCVKGHIVELEGPQEVVEYRGGQEYGSGGQTSSTSTSKSVGSSTSEMTFPLHTQKPTWTIGGDEPDPVVVTSIVETVTITVTSG